MFTVDESLLTNQLEAATAERVRLCEELAHVEKLIGWLEEGAALAAPSATGEPEPAPLEPPAERAPRSPRRQPAGGSRMTATDVKAKTLAAVLKSNRPLPFAAIAAQVEGSDDAIRRALKQLVADGQVLAEGATVNRRYSRVKQREFHSTARAKTETTAASNARKMTDAVSQVGLRDRVLKAIVADPGQLTADRLAQALDAHPDDVAKACEQLISRGRIQQDALDFTYRRNGHAEVPA